jgi:hypothetical protein
MSPLDPLLMYMVFGLSNSTTQCILHSPLAPDERGTETSLGGLKSAEADQKSTGIGR